VEDADRPARLECADNLSHLIGIERLLEGLPSAELPDGRPPVYVRNPIGEFNEAEVAARRSLSGAEVLGEWNELRAVRERTLAEGDADYFAQPMKTPTGPGTMADFLGVRILDCWVHEQDMRRALALPGTFAVPAAERTVDGLTRSLPMVVGKRASCPEGGAIAIELTGPVARQFVCEVTAGRAAFVESATAPPLATITMDTESYLLLANGRRTPAELADRVSVGGDADLAGAALAGMNVMF
jgi:uncharacterized protein (TIGR03083 family)